MREAEEIHSITLEERAAVDRLYGSYGFGDCAHAFPSLFLWQDEMGLSLETDRSCYTVRSRWRGEGAWFFPVGDDAGKIRCLEKLLERGLRRLCYMTEADVRFLESRFPGLFSVREAPEDSEYLYDRREMIGMNGRRFVKIRNLYRRLAREHTVAAEPITESSLPLAAEITEAWRPESSPEDGITDARFMRRMYASWTALGMSGVILRVDGDPWAVAAGYPLSGGTFDCCLMKAKRNMAGVTEHLRASLAGMLPGSVEQVNLEEDMGLDGLRLMKKRFRPCGYIRMFTGDRS